MFELIESNLMFISWIVLFMNKIVTFNIIHAYWHYCSCYKGLCVCICSRQLFWFLTFINCSQIMPCEYHIGIHFCVVARCCVAIIVRGDGIRKRKTTLIAVSNIICLSFINWTWRRVWRICIYMKNILSLFYVWFLPFSIIRDLLC